VYLGIDIGTSGVKAVLVDDGDRTLAEASTPLEVQRPQPLWSEQDPEAWWAATERALDAIASTKKPLMAGVRAMGLSGQMLGVALLDAADRPLRPALLWNDGRAAAECDAIEQAISGFAKLVGCRAMPGFPAPKLLWLARHEAATLARARHTLLTKDYVRLKLSGEAATDLADGSATLLMDTQAGVWSEEIVHACGVSTEMLPRIVESGAVSATLRPILSERWGLPRGLPIAGGGGDNMCGAVGAGVVRRGQAFISLGTSGVYFVANDRFVPALSGGMHTHRHAVPGLFAHHGVVLSAASALVWLAALLGKPLDRFIAEIDVADTDIERVPVFTPYLGGERTPHNDALATGTFSNLRFETDPADLGRAVLDGVALALADCQDALLGDEAPIEDIALIGGGSRSRLWAEIIATVIGKPLRVPAAAAVGPALGAARLARAAVGGPLVATTDDAEVAVSPRAEWHDAYCRKREIFRKHYAALRQANSG
jgi:xylulokinase